MSHPEEPNQPAPVEASLSEELPPSPPASGSLGALESPAGLPGKVPELKQHAPIEPGTDPLSAVSPTTLGADALDQRKFRVSYLLRRLAEYSHENYGNRTSLPGWLVDVFQDAESRAFRRLKLAPPEPPRAAGAPRGGEPDAASGQAAPFSSWQATAGEASLLAARQLQRVREPEALVITVRSLASRLRNPDEARALLRSLAVPVRRFQADMSHRVRVVDAVLAVYSAGSESLRSALGAQWAQLVPALAGFIEPVRPEIPDDDWCVTRAVLATISTADDPLVSLFLLEDLVELVRQALQDPARRERIEAALAQGSIQWLSDALHNLGAHIGNRAQELKQGSPAAVRVQGSLLRARVGRALERAEALEPEQVGPARSVLARMLPSLKLPDDSPRTLARYGVVISDLAAVPTARSTRLSQLDQSYWLSVSGLFSLASRHTERIATDFFNAGVELARARRDRKLADDKVEVLVYTLGAWLSIQLPPSEGAALLQQNVAQCLVNIFGEVVRIKRSSGLDLDSQARRIAESLSQYRDALHPALAERLPLILGAYKLPPYPEQAALSVADSVGQLLLVLLRSWELVTDALPAPDAATWAALLPRAYAWLADAESGEPLEARVAKNVQDVASQTDSFTSSLRVLFESSEPGPFCVQAGVLTPEEWDQLAKRTLQPDDDPAAQLQQF